MKPTKDTLKLKLLCQRVNDYLQSGGLFNPEMADHGSVRDLLIDLRNSIQEHIDLDPPACPSCGNKWSMVLHDDGKWYCHKTHMRD